MPSIRPAELPADVSLMMIVSGQFAFIIDRAMHLLPPYQLRRRSERCMTYNAAPASPRVLGH